VRCVLDLCGASEFLVFGREDVVHGVAGNECSGAERDGELVARVIVIARDLGPSSRDLRSKERGHDRGSEAVKRGVNVPAVETREVQIITIGDLGGMKGAVVRMAQLNVLEPFVLRDEAVADDLDLRLVRNGLEVRMQY
jgi:hypothetical protein